MNTVPSALPLDLSVNSTFRDLLGKEPLRIWFNQTYGTNYWIVKMVQENPDNIPVHVITTSDKVDSPVLLAGNESHIEPSRDILTGNDYVDWALKFCKDKAVRVFVPMREIAAISGRMDEFRSLGVSVLASPKDSIELLEDKNLAYISARDNGIPVPPWRIASTEKDFRDAYVSLMDEIEGKESICIKPVQGVGGEGYRKIVTTQTTIDELLIKPKHVVNLKDLLDLFKRTEDSGVALPEFMLMPYLAEPEISVDCLSDIHGNILSAIPRSKDDKYRTISTEEHESIEIARQMAKIYKLAYLTNTQTRFYRGKPVLLETNARISGGMFASTFAGINMPWEGIKLAMFGETERIPEVVKGAQYTAVPYLIRVN